MNVLVVNHTGLVSGAEVATLNLLRALPREIDATLAAPEGPMAEQARRAGIRVVPVDGMVGSLRLHPVETARGVKDLVRLGWAIARLARATGADLIHAASIRAGLAAALRPETGRPLVVSLHDCLPPGPLSAVTKQLIDLRAAAVVANSRHSAAAWRPRRRGGPPIRVAYPPIELARYRTGIEPERLGLDGRAPVLGVAAQITPWKGQDTAIRALAGVRESFPDAQLVLAGEPVFVDRATRYDNHAYLGALKRLISELGLESSVRFIGRRDDMPSVMAGLDALLVPSWEEPFGLVTVEAMASGTPVVATNVGGPVEVIQDGVNGRLVPPDRPDLWAEAVTTLLASPPIQDRMKTEGLATASRFGPQGYADAIAGIYRAVAGDRRS